MNSQRNDVQVPLPPGVVTYLTRLPAKVPAGTFLVHNRVRPAPMLGMRGFRAWLADSDSRLDRCDCGWAARLGTHYRVAGA